MIRDVKVRSLIFLKNFIFVKLLSVYGIKEYDKILFVSFGVLNILQLFGQLYYRISESFCVIKCV